MFSCCLRQRLVRPGRQEHHLLCFSSVVSLLLQSSMCVFRDGLPLSCDRKFFDLLFLQSPAYSPLILSRHFVCHQLPLWIFYISYQLNSSGKNLHLDAWMQRSCSVCLAEIPFMLKAKWPGCVRSRIQTLNLTTTSYCQASFPSEAYRVKEGHNVHFS